MGLAHFALWRPWVGGRLARQLLARPREIAACVACEGLPSAAQRRSTAPDDRAKTRASALPIAHTALDPSSLHVLPYLPTQHGVRSQIAAQAREAQPKQ